MREIDSWFQSQTEKTEMNTSTKQLLSEENNYAEAVCHCARSGLVIHEII